MNDFRLLTSLRLESGRCHLLPLHLDRLGNDADALGFSLDRSALEEALVRFAAGHESRAPARLRVTVDQEGRWIMERPEPLLEAGPLRAMVWPDRSNSREPHLRHSTTYRPAYDHALAEAERRGYVDAIFVNEAGMVTEGAMHSLFVRHADRWRTPPLHGGVLPGVYRRHLLETRPEISEADVALDELFLADEVWLTSAVHGIRPVVVDR